MAACPLTERTMTLARRPFLALAGLGLLPALREQRQLLRPPNQGREAGGPKSGEPALIDVVMQPR